MRKGDLYELLLESICEDCLAANEDCYDGGNKCFFWGDLEDLERLCEKTEDLAIAIKHSAEKYTPMDYSPYDDRL